MRRLVTWLVLAAVVAVSGCATVTKLTEQEWVRQQAVDALESRLVAQGVSAAAIDAADLSQMFDSVLAARSWQEVGDAIVVNPAISVMASNYFAAAIDKGVETNDAPVPVMAGIGVPGVEKGFLYKPISESNGKLVVLLPPGYTGNIVSCCITDKDGALIEAGHYKGVYNGGRAHFTFVKDGAGYGDNVYVVARVPAVVHWVIADGSERDER